MTNEELDIFIKREFEKIKVQVGTENPLDFYIFQTDYCVSPELMIVGINPGGEAKNNAFKIGSYLRSDSITRHSNYKEDHPWFNHLKTIFDFPGVSDLAHAFDECVGLNLCPYNTRNENDMQAKVANETRCLLSTTIIEIIDAIAPKHIITLGRQPFYTLRGRNLITYKKVDAINLRFSQHGKTPLCWLYNPSRRNSSRYAKTDLKKLQSELTAFLHK